MRRTGTVALASGLLLVAGCTVGGPATVPLAELANHQDQYIGQQVTVGGTVAAFGDPSLRYYVLEDDAGLNMVELRPAPTAARHAGARVTVVGRFGFDPRTGRYIDIASVNSQ